MVAASLTPRSVIARASEAFDVKVGGALVVYDPDSDRYARLNRTAALLWEQLARPSPLADLAAGLVARYGIEPDRATRDVEAVVSALIERSMVQVVSEGAQTGNVAPLG